MRNFSTFIVEKRNALLGLEYHSGLSRKIWTKEEKLSGGLRADLLSYAYQWLEYAHLDKDIVVDIVLTGSLCNFSYTSLSDIDIHIIVDLSKSPFKDADFAFRYFMDKRKEWTREKHIQIRGFPVEIVAQIEGASFTAGGIYSILKDKWIKHPENLHLDFSKMHDLDYEVLKISEEIKTLSSLEDAVKLKNKLHLMRVESLQNGTEFSFWNLVYKSLRNRGDLNKLKIFIKTHENI